MLYGLRIACYRGARLQDTRLPGPRLQHTARDDRVNFGCCHSVSSLCDGGEISGALSPPEPAQNASGHKVHLGYDPLSERSVTRDLHRARGEHLLWCPTTTA